MILIPSEETVFNTELIKRQGFLRCKCDGWLDWKNCLVTHVAPTLIKGIACGAGSTMIYVKIPAADVCAGLWQIIYSTDLVEIYDTADTQETAPEP